MGRWEGGRKAWGHRKTQNVPIARIDLRVVLGRAVGERCGRLTVRRMGGMLRSPAGG